MGSVPSQSNKKAAILNLPPQSSLNTTLIWRRLASIQNRSRRSGEALFACGAASEVVQSESGEYSVSVTERGNEFLVVIVLSSSACETFCDCEVWGCAHQTAALLALLGHVQSGRAMPGDHVGQSLKLPAKAEKLELEEWARSKHERSLSQAEKKDVAILQRMYNRYASTGTVDYWGLQELGLASVDETFFKTCQPSNSVEFCEVLCFAIKQTGYPLPEVLACIVETTRVGNLVQTAQREEDIRAWKLSLEDDATEPPDGLEKPDSEPIDLRLVVGARSAHLEWRVSGEPKYRKLRYSHLNKLHWSSGMPDPRLSPAGQMLRSAVMPMNSYSYHKSGELDFAVVEHLRILESILRVATLDSCIVSDDYSPLRRNSETLSWAIKETESTPKDYLIKLVLPDGSPAPGIRASMPGGLVLTDRGIFNGPKVPRALRGLEEFVRIPADALESTEGAAFLSANNIPLPPAIQSRVRTEAYKVSITCKLQRGLGGEWCEFHVAASAKNGPRMVWRGTWFESGSGQNQHSAGNGEIVLLEKKALQEAAGLLQKLPLKRLGRENDGLGIKMRREFGNRFGEWLKSVPSHIRVRLEGELESFISGDVAGNLKLDVTEAEIDWFDLKVVLDVSDTTLSPAEIKLLLGAKGGYVRLEGKGWRRLRYELTEEDNASLAKLGLSATEFGAEPQRLHALQLGHESARRFIAEEQVQRIERRVGEIKTRVTPELPANVSASLRGYQIEGFHFLAFLATNRFGGILADDMGLGKTIETLTWLAWLRQEAMTEAATQSLPPSLVVCPKSVMDNWHAEAQRFVRGLRVRVWNAETVQTLYESLAVADVHVINYAQLRLLGERLSNTRWLAAILDEGQYIKNPASQTAVLARGLKAQHRLILTGTPIENRLLDLWSLMSYAMPGVLGNRAHFTRIYDSKTDPLARQRLAARVRPFLLRRTKSQVAKDLPDKVEEDLFCEMEGDQLAMYRAELKRAQQMLLSLKTQKELARQQFNFLTSLLRLRQICCDPRLLVPDSKAPGAKLDALIEQIEPLMDEGQKVLVFSQFVEMLSLLRTAIEAREWPVFYLAGETEDRGPLVKEFNDTAGPSVFLISLKAGGFGLNLASASYVILFDPWWNPAVENQAIDRTHRIGQVNKVIAYRLLIKNSVEEKIRALQKAKSALAEDVLGEERFAQSLTIDDMRFLLADV